MIENENTTNETEETSAGAAPAVVEPPVPAPPQAPPDADAALDAGVDARPQTAPRVARAASTSGWALGTGRRKTSVARVRIRPGSGKIVVNGKPYEEYFPTERDQKDILNVLQKTNTQESVDVHVKTSGGGVTGQAGSIVLGIARALRQHDPNLESILRDNDFLTRDPREVERKKYGLAGARRRYQFSKR